MSHKTFYKCLSLRVRERCDWLQQLSWKCCDWLRLQQLCLTSIYQHVSFRI